MNTQSFAPASSPVECLKSPQELIIIDSRVAGIQHLGLERLSSNFAWVILDAEQDSIFAINRFFQAYKNISAIHLIAHGEPGCLYLGKTPLTLENIKHYAHQIQNWQQFLHAQADILIYGCCVAAQELGLSLLRTLHQLTGANIAASSTPIGHQDLGGNWDLDVQLGSIQTSPVISSDGQAAYRGLLNAQALFVIDPPGNNINNSTYSSGSFVLSNTSSTAQKITRIRVDLSSSILPNMVFDPYGLAGDVVAKDFSIDSDSGVGLVNHTYFLPKNEGYSGLEINFNNFTPGKTLKFSVDVDPTSIKGLPAPVLWRIG
uniref:DUF4347 domain-containing protein n=1 Tax=Desertifilum tharense IPPAS B-1220 TaxID=1781255 RepID=A0ACD5GR86_9CYAN